MVAHFPYIRANGHCRAAGSGDAADMIRTCNEVILMGLGLVFWMPCQGYFMWPFAVAGLGFRYLRMSLQTYVGTL
jgi:hypothetical protein